MTIHWDTIGTLEINRIDFLSCPPGVGCASGGISSGIGSSTTEVSSVRATDNYVENGSFGIHGSACLAGALATRMFFAGNTFGAIGTNYGLDFSLNNANCYFEVMIEGSQQRYFNVDPSGGIVLDLPADATAAQKIYIFTDGALRTGSNLSIAGTYFHNAFVYPATKQPAQAPTDGVVSGDLLVYSPTGQTVASTTTANAQWPVVAINQADSSGTPGWFPRLATGSHAAVFVAAGTAVAVGDILVTSTTAKDATVNNGQADLTRILGWAESTKSAGVRSLVNVRLNKATGLVGTTWGTVDVSSRLTIPVADLVVGTCTVNTIANDTGGATREHCVCGTTNVWGCWNLATGTFNANGPAD